MVLLKGCPRPLTCAPSAVLSRPVRLFFPPYPVRSEDQALENPLYIDMILDILSERGFSVNVDSKIIERPVRVHFSTLQVINEMCVVEGRWTTPALTALQTRWTARIHLPAHVLTALRTHSRASSMCADHRKHAHFFQIAFPRQTLRGDWVH